MGISTLTCSSPVITAKRRLLRQRSGSFLRRTGYQIQGSFQAHTTIADFNNDGLGDVFLQNGTAPSQIWLNNGSGFTLSDTYNSPAGNSFYQNVNFARAADLNGDGNIDLYLVKTDDFAPSADHILFGDGQGHFAESGVALPLHGNVAGADLGDVNGDGFTDIFRP